MKYLLCLALAVASGSSALAGVACYPREALIEQMTQKYGEHQRVIGMTTSNTIFEIWASPSENTFTMIITDGDGMSCVAATGGAFHVVPWPVAGEPS